MQPLTSPAISIISQMITPALLIVATGSLLGLVLGRLVRVVEHVRALKNTPMEERSERINLLHILERRADYAEKSVTAFFLAVTSFVTTCLLICFDHFTNGAYYWLPVSTAVIGVLFLISGSAFMLAECRVSIGQIKGEIEQARAVIG